ncbi:hypothetical protein M501DRAFT_1019143 [Patellaria atrata CBS 101060]|uniref:Uncharacterized protein n=1 Tax=Patellaria atrata CBS 101060 TaxID=1346257 RepID=A0A9P4S6U7_9PEZI|nr:hypothetical protein M501DRAFT_1019143 [Patellaria atrata CBS 101060]
MPLTVAQILSDINTLRVCDPSAALALVSIRPGDGSEQSTSTIQSKDDDDQDLRRARELVELHQTVKIAQREGLDRELREAREEVRRVVAELGR